MNDRNAEVALLELTQALHHHERWHRDLARTLICRLPVDAGDIASDAHRRCRFGNWCYEKAAVDVHDDAVFAAMEAEHERMHGLAAGLLQASAAGLPIAAEDYDRFADAVEGLGMQIQTLRRALEASADHHDSLTGAENRVDMLTRLGELRELGRRRHQPSCIALMDLDGFKQINDTHGHLIGDQVLKASVRYLRAHLRPYDHVFRFGGDEFLILMPDTELDAGRLAIERIRQGLAEARLARSGPAVIHATASFGVAPVDPDSTVEASMDCADRMTYAAKEAGRNCVRVWRVAGAGGNLPSRHDQAD